MGQSRRIPQLPALAAILLLACGEAGPADRWAGTVETLPNGAVRVTNPPAPVWTTEDAWRLEHALSLGEAEGADEVVFGSVSGLEVDDAGRIYVLDRQANELRIFDGAGAHVRTVGRAGEGPGEYSAANGLLWLADDSLIVVDQEGARYSILHREGDYVRSVLRNLPFFGWAFRGGLDGDHIYEFFSIAGGDDDDRRPVLLGTRIRGEGMNAGTTAEPSAAGESAPVFQADTIRIAQPDGPLYESFSVRTERGGMVIGVPFAGGPQYRMDGTGGLWHGHSATPRLYHSTFEGDTLTEIVLATEPAPVTPEEVDEWASQESLERFRDLGGELDLSRIPKTKPYYDGMSVDPDGYLWLGVPTAPMRAAFAVLDPDGRYLGDVAVDGLERDVYVPFVVHGDRLYFVGRDELDVQRIYVYRIAKAGEEAEDR